jgi:hypothetical protein
MSRCVSIKLLDVTLASLNSKCPPDSGLRQQVVIAALDAFISSGARPETTRALGLRLNSKVGDASRLGLKLRDELHRHYSAYAASCGVTLASLVNSAVAAALFGLQAPVVVPEQKAPPVSSGWRRVLLALAVGETREFLKCDLGASVAKAKANLFAAAAEVRRTIPAFRVITNQQPGALYVARTA